MQFSNNLLRLGTESAFEVLARAQSMVSKGRDIINLGIGQPDFKTADHIVEAGVQALRVAIMVILLPTEFYHLGRQFQRIF